MNTLADEINDSLSRSSLSKGDNLLGFEIDVRHALESQGQFAEVKTSRTGDRQCVLVVSCVASSQLADLETIGHTLRKLWLEKVCYAHHQAHELADGPDQVTLHFVTRSGDDKGSLCVTGKIAVRMPYQFGS